MNSPTKPKEIRTLKEDYEKFRLGTQKTDAPEISAQQFAAQSPAKATTEKNTVQKSPSPLGPEKPFPFPPQPNITTSQPRLDQKAVLELTKSEGFPAPLGTDSYFSEKSPFEKINQGVESGNTGSVAPEKKSGKFGIILASIILILAILGGVFYYYWFYLKKSLPGLTAKSPTPPQAQTQTSKNVWPLMIASEASSGEFQTALKKMATDFLSTSSSGDLIEVRPVGADNEQLPVKTFVSLFSLGLPETISQKFSSDDYGLFLKNENSEIRVGLVFKLSNSENMARELAQQESTLVSKMGSLYLDQQPTASNYIFSGAKYKNADIRYYNSTSLPNTSLDYSVINGKGNSYLIFSSSKNTIRAILDYMSEK